MLEDYVEGIVGAFGQDPRVLAWDIWNKPQNHGGGEGYYESGEAPHKLARVLELLPQAFAWARSRHPLQPLTSAVSSQDDWSQISKLDPIEAMQLEQSDVISCHDYNWPERFETRIRQLTQYGRPLICTEYLARGVGSTIDGSLPIGKNLHVGMINWGFVDGKTQTRFPWDSWLKPYTLREPAVWHHDLLRSDGTPYRAREAEILRSLSARPAGH